MQLKNTHYRYGVISITLHWFSALLIIFTFAIGFYLDSLSWGIEKFDLVDIHASIGFLIIFFILLRLLWRFYSPLPSSIITNKTHTFGVNVMHFIMLLMLTALFFSGYIMLSSGGNPITLFGTLSMPDLPANNGIAKQFRRFHEIVVWVFIGLLSVHVLAALFHHFIKRDSTIKRMLGLTHEHLKKEV